MARSDVSVLRAREHIVLRQSYYWPENQLIFWIIVMIVISIELITQFARLSEQQGRLELGSPWIIPYGVTVGALTLVFVIVFLIQTFQRKLIPGGVLLISFIMLVLFLTGMIETAIQNFGHVNPACQKYVYNQPSTGVTTENLIWLLQDDICQTWNIAFAFWAVGMFFWIWLMVLARSVAQGSTST